MDIHSIRTYHPDPRHHDERPAILNAGTLAADPETLVTVITAALVNRGNVVTQKTMRLGDGVERLQHASARAREAQEAEARP